MKGIFALCAPYWKEKRAQLVCYVLCCLLSGLVALVLPYVTGSFIDTLIARPGEPFIAGYLLALSAFGLLEIALGYGVNRLYTRLQVYVGCRIDRDAIAHVQRVSLNRLKAWDTAYLSRRINNDSNMITMFTMNVLHQLPLNVIFLLAPAALLFRFHSGLALSLLGVGGLYALGYVLLKKPLYKARMELEEGTARFFARESEQLHNVRFVQTHGLTRTFVQRMLHAFTPVYRSALRFQRVDYGYTAVDRLVLLLANLLAYGIGGAAVLRGTLSVGHFAIVISYFTMLMGALRYFFQFGQDVAEVTVFRDRLDEVFGMPAQENGAALPDGISDVELRHVSFSYDEKRRVLRDFSCRFEKGGAYALTGENGSGKSTLISLLIGLYPGEYEGELLYNGAPVSLLDMIGVRNRLIGVSEQEPALIADTLRSNLTLDGEISCSDAQILDCCRILGADALIERLPDGLDTLVQEGTANLSGGEKQRIALARTMLKNPDVMILDEPTSALDRDGRERFLRYLDETRADRILIVSTHDPELVRLCGQEIHLDRADAI